MSNYYEYRLYKPYKNNLYDKIEKSWMQCDIDRIIFLNQSKYILLTPSLFLPIMKKYNIQRKVLNSDIIKNLILLLQRDRWDYNIITASDLIPRIKDLESEDDDEEYVLKNTMSMIRERFVMNKNDEVFLHANIELKNIEIEANITIKNALSIDIENKFFLNKNKEVFTKFTSILDEVLAIRQLSE